MYSNKYTPWELVSKYPHIVSDDKLGLYSIYCSDPFIERFLLNRLALMEKTVVSGIDISIDWIESNIKNLDLFSEKRSFLIIQSHFIKDSVYKYLENFALEEDRYIIFCFNSNKEKTFTRLSKITSGTFYDINLPKFWEYDKLISFFANEMKIDLNLQARNFILDAVPHNSGDIIFALESIACNFKDTSKITLKELKPIICSNRLDQFYLADIFSKHKRREFFKLLLDIELDFDSYRYFFSFMQSHLFKISSLSYMKNKSRLSRYDLKIKNYRSSWSIDKLIDEIKNFAKLEVEAKRKNPNLKDLIRREIINYCGVDY